MAYRGADKAKVVLVIETQAPKTVKIEKNGEEQEIVTVTTQYWDFDGNILAENDGIKKE